MSIHIDPYSSEGDLLCHKDVAGVVSGPTINGEIQSIRLCLEHIHRCDDDDIELRSIHGIGAYSSLGWLYHSAMRSIYHITLPGSMKAAKSPYYNLGHDIAGLVVS